MLDVSALRARLGRHREVLAGVDLRCPRGAIVGIAGASGSGKTTLLRALAGLVEDQDGEVRLDGIDLYPVPVAKRPVSFLQQDFPLYEHLAVLENVAVALESTVRDASARRARAAAMLERLGIGADLHQRAPGRLSGGESQRTALAKALLKPTSLLLLDEPFSNLDKANKRAALAVIREQVLERQLSCVIVSHDEADLLLLSDAVTILVQGRLAVPQTVGEIAVRPATGRFASLGFPVGIQGVPRDAANALAPDRAFLGRIPDECTTLAWWPHAVRLLQGHACDDAGDVALRIRGAWLRGVAIGATVYHCIDASLGDQSQQFWVAEPRGGGRQRTYVPGEHLSLSVPFSQLLYLDESDHVLPHSGQE